MNSVNNGDHLNLVNPAKPKHERFFQKTTFALPVLSSRAAQLSYLMREITILSLNEAT
ncbi:MAG: hypothetical protein R3C28_21195 [Pirellulaceae bacterium]